MALTSIEISNEKKRMIFSAGMTLNGVFERGFQKIFIEDSTKTELRLNQMQKALDMYIRLQGKLNCRIAELEEKNVALEKEVDELRRVRKTFKKNSRGAE